MANKITRIQGGTLRTARAQDATVGMNLQTYNGEYNVTPTTEQQTLATRNRLLTNNITVDPMSTDYEILTNKPQINDVTLSGNKSLEDLGIASEADLDGKQDAITASGILKGDGAGNVTAATAGTDYGTYSKPSGGIPSSDMASAVQTSLGKANTAYQKPSGGIPSTDMATAVQTSLGKADSAYQKPVGGIPSTDIAGLPVFEPKIMLSGSVFTINKTFDEIAAAIQAGTCDHAYRMNDTIKVILPITETTSSLIRFAEVTVGTSPKKLNWKEYTITSSGMKSIGTKTVTEPTIDTTLATTGAAADAKATGDALADKLDAPTTAGTQGQVLTSDGEGGQTWEDASGGGGTDDYTDLENKPQINSVTLTGNKSLSDLGIASASDLDGKQAKITASGILKGDGSGGVTAATSGTDYGTYSKPSGGIPSSDMASAVQTSLGKADTAYQKPSGGIPDTDIASASTWNGKYAKPSGGIPSTDLASAVQTSLGKADTAYQKPSGGIPGTDLASGVIPTVPSASDATPQALGSAAAGSSSNYSRADHVHAKPSAADIGAIPTPSTAGTNGQVLTSDGNGGQTWQTISGLLPSVSSGDNGKFLRVSNGAWAAETVPTAVGVSF